MTSRTFRWILCFVTLWIVLNVVVLYHMTKEARKVEWSVRGSLDRFFPSSSSGSSPALNIAPTTSSQLPPSQKREEGGEPLPGQKQKDIAADDEEGGEHESPDDPEEDHSGSDTGGEGGGDIGVERRTHHHHHQHDTKHQEEDHQEHKSPKDPTTKKKNKVQRSKGNSVAAAPTTPHEIFRRARPGGVTASHEPAAIAFLLVGDWGGPGRPPQKNVAKAMDTIASRPNGTIDFVISTGDNMYEDGVENEFSKKFQRNFESVYTYPSLQCRWYMSFGNHDHGAHGVMRDSQGEVNYTKHSTRWFLPSTYYKQSILLLLEEGSEDDNAGAADDRRSKSISLSVDLFVLDTYDYSPYVTQMTAPQLQWFEESLQQSKAQVKLVVGHRPMFSAGAKHGSSPYMRKTIEPLLKKYGVAAYMCGDDHELQVLESEGVLHLLSGGGARAKHDLKKKGVPQTIFQSGVNGFMRVEVSRSTVVVEVFDQFAVPLYDLTFPIGSLEEGKRLREKQVLLP